MNVSQRRLTIVQYAGDFREAAERFAAGGAETYRGQQYTVRHVEQLAARFQSVTTIAGMTDEAYDVTLPSGARAIGAGFRDRFDEAALVRLIAETKPDLLILRAPLRRVMVWAILRRCRTMLLLADSFDGRTFKRRMGRRLFAMLARSLVFDVVANHGIRAARQLADAGISAGKIVAWDYPPFDTPHARPVKTAAGPAPHILYVGLLIAEKGVVDLIDAIAALRRRNIAVTAELIGKGDHHGLQSRIDRAGLRDAIRLPGIVPNREIVTRMAEADVVVVPSRHDYAEGMPLTIYEAFCSRTPLIVSDHPMFAGNVVHDVSGLIFEAGNTAALATEIERLLCDAQLYATLSINGAEAWERLQIPVRWDVLIDHWLANDAPARAWLRRHALAAARAER